MAQGMQELDPSPEFRGGHERAIRYFEEFLEVSRSITQAAMNKQRDKLLMELFPLSGQVLCDARRDLSAEFIPLLVDVFGPETPPFCK